VKCLKKGKVAGRRGKEILLLVICCASELASASQWYPMFIYIERITSRASLKIICSDRQTIRLVATILARHRRQGEYRPYRGLIGGLEIHVHGSLAIAALLGPPLFEVLVRFDIVDGSLSIGPDLDGLTGWETGW